MKVRECYSEREGKETRPIEYCAGYLADFLRRIIVPVEEQEESLCRTSVLLLLFPLEDNMLVCLVRARKEAVQLVVCG